MLNAIPARNLPVSNFAYHLLKPWADRFAHVYGKLLPRLSVKEPGYPVVYGQNSVTSMHDYSLVGSLGRYKTRTRTTLHTYQTIVAIAVPICKWVDLVPVLYLPVLFCNATGIHCCEIRYSSNSKTRLNGKISGLDENKHSGYSSICTKGLRKFLNLLQLMQA